MKRVISKKTNEKSADNNKLELGRPFVISIKNFSDEKKEVALFGTVTAYQRSKDPLVIIRNISADNTFEYEDMLSVIGFNPFFVGKVHTEFTKGHIPKGSSVSKLAIVKNNYINGSYHNDLRIINLLDPNSYQDHVFVTYFKVSDPLLISSSSRFCITMPPTSEFTITFYPINLPFDVNNVIPAVKNVLSFCASEYEITKKIMEEERIRLRQQLQREMDLNLYSQSKNKKSNTKGFPIPIVNKPIKFAYATEYPIKKLKSMVTTALSKKSVPKKTRNKKVK